MLKKTFLLLLITCFVVFQFDFSRFVKAQIDSGEEGAISEEIALASGGSVQAICTGNVPFQKLVVNKGGFNTVIIDPETGLLQLTIDIQKTTNKNILEFKYTLLLNPEDAINLLLKGKPVDLDLNNDNVKLSLKSTNLATGETIEVANEVRKLIEQEGQNAIDTDFTVPIMGNFKISTVGNLASGTLRVVFSNTNRIIEKASDVIGEPITISENGEVSAIGRFKNIPINGSFQNLAGIDLNNLPKGINPQNLPEGIDINNLPLKIMDITTFGPGIDLNDLVNLPVGFNLMDITELPEGFNIGDLTKIPPGYTPEDLAKLPTGFNLDDFVKFPQGVDLDNLPPGFMIEDLALFPPLSDIKDLPSGVTPQDLKNLPSGIKLSDLANINPNDPGSINLICENGVIKPGVQPFIQPGISSNICSMPPGSPTDISTICEDGMIKPGFEPFVPAGFDCNLIIAP